MTTAEIDALIAAFYAAFDNRDRLPDTNALAKLFAADARITRVSSARVDEWTVEEFIRPRAEILSDGTLVDFHEWEVRGTTTVAGNIASRDSQYQKVGTLNGASYMGQGRKFIQLCRANGRWMITSILWQDDERGEA